MSLKSKFAVLASTLAVSGAMLFNAQSADAQTRATVTPQDNTTIAKLVRPVAATSNDNKTALETLTEGLKAKIVKGTSDDASDFAKANKNKFVIWVGSGTNKADDVALKGAVQTLNYASRFGITLDDVVVYDDRIPSDKVDILAGIYTGELYYGHFEKSTSKEYTRIAAMRFLKNNNRELPIEYAQTSASRPEQPAPREP